jgi:hypothetical protein
MNKLPLGSVVADIHGNPDVNANFMARNNSDRKPIIDTYCKVMSAKDAIRNKQRWGPRTDSKGNVRWIEGTVYDMYRTEESSRDFAKYDHFLMNHVIYYYTMNEIVRLLHMNKDAVLFATLHKLPGQNGTINCGEQSYQKDLITGKVTQTNVDTGEFYTHGDPSVWFKNFCYADRDGAISWTMSKLCDDLYFVTITSCPPNLVEEQYWEGQRMYYGDIQVTTAPTALADQPAPAYVEAEVVIKGNKLVPGRKGRDRIVKIKHPDFFNSLTSFMVNKPRSMATLRDLTAKAHREAGNNVLLGKRQGAKLDLTAELLTEYIAAAFTQNECLERELWSSVLQDGSAAARGQYSGVVKQGLKVLLAGRSVLNSKDPTDKVLHMLDDLL